MKSAWERERSCEIAFQENGPFWHLFTSGLLMSVIFADEEAYRFAMNLMAKCATEFHNIKLLAFQIMSNHIHCVVSGRRDDILLFFDSFKKRLARYLRSSNRGSSILDNFLPTAKPIETLKSLRNTIVYVNRNGYVADPNHTPFSYPWGTGRYYFNDFPISETCSKLTSTEKRAMLRCRSYDIPPDFLMIEGHIAPKSYCDCNLGMQMFRDAHQYFFMITKNVESYADIAEETDDREFYTDDEIFSITTKWCRDRYQNPNFRELSKNQLFETARELHFRYKVSNGQLRRLLNISQQEIDSIFPLTAK